jgi:CRP-like cAMP-binding protein
MLPPRIRHSYRGNHLLRALRADDRVLLGRAIRIEHPLANHVISSRTDPTTDIWFPHLGVIALAVTDREGRTAQTGLVGPEGCVGLESIFGQKPAMVESWVQIAGEMSVISATPLRLAAQARPAIHVILAQFLFDLTAQTLQTVACNRLHSLEVRCCRWLLMMRDRTDADEILLTQESLATMLGGGRPRINVLLARLERDGLIRRYRGRIRLLTRVGLEGRACECYTRLLH